MSFNKNYFLGINKLLDAFPSYNFERIAPHLELVSLSSGQILYEAEETIKYVYFPHQSVVSILCTMENTATVEVGLVSNEGMVGIPVILGDNIAPLTTMVEVPDSALRLNADIMKVEFDRGGALQKLLLRYVKSVYIEIAQCAACNRLHSLEERLARWLLTVSDRLQLDEFPLTQEFIAHMLGVRRAGVTVAAHTLSKAGIMSYHRGHIQILNREALETNACECYRVIKNQFAQFSQYLANSVEDNS
jgi:CRP-like cAMP-binding protein